MEFGSYNIKRDKDQLLSICKDVWGGTDYLPTILDDFVADPRCHTFVIRDDIPNEGKQLVAFGVLRRETDSNIFNIKSIRINQKSERKGYCTSLYTFLIEQAKSLGASELVFLTKLNNDAMQKIAKRFSFSLMSPLLFSFYFDHNKIKSLCFSSHQQEWLPTKDMNSVLEISNKIHNVKNVVAGEYDYYFILGDKFQGWLENGYIYVTLNPPSIMVLKPAWESKGAMTICGVTTDHFDVLESALYFATKRTDKEILLFAPNSPVDNTNGALFNGCFQMVLTFYRKCI